MQRLHPCGCGLFSFTKISLAIYNEKDMVYLSQTTNTQTCYMPIVERKPTDGLSLRFVSTMTNKVFNCECHNKGTAYSHYCLFELSLPSGIQEGEYQYELFDEEGSLSVGILVVGDPDKPMEHDNTMEYEQYEN